MLFLSQLGEDTRVTDFVWVPSDCSRSQRQGCNEMASRARVAAPAANDFKFAVAV